MAMSATRLDSQRNHLRLYFFKRHVQKVAMKLKTSLCYNPDLERLTLTIYDLKGLEVSG